MLKICKIILRVILIEFVINYLLQIIKPKNNEIAALEKFKQVRAV